MPCPVSSQSPLPVVPHLACRAFVPCPEISVKFPLNSRATTVLSPDHVWTEISRRRIPGVLLDDVLGTSFRVDGAFTVGFGRVLSMSAAFLSLTFYGWEKMRKFDTSTKTFFRMFI
jgi:hypothetical protein